MGVDDVDGKFVSWGWDADYDVAIGAGEMTGESVGCEQGFGGDAGGEDGAVAGVEVSAEEVGEYVDGGV